MKYEKTILAESNDSALFVIIFLIFRSCNRTIFVYFNSYWLTFFKYNVNI